MVRTLQRLTAKLVTTAARPKGRRKLRSKFLRVARRQEISGPIPVAVQVFAQHVEPGAAPSDAVLVRHRHDVNAVPLEVPPGVVVIPQESPDQPLDDPVSTRLPGVRPGADQHPKRRLRIAHPDDLQLPSFHGAADRGDLDRPMRANRLLELLHNELGG